MVSRGTLVSEIFVAIVMNVLNEQFYASNGFAFGKTFTNPVPRKSSLQTLLKDPGISKESLAVIQTMSDSVAASETIQVIPQWADIQDRIGALVSKVMSQQSSPEDAVNAAQTDLEKLMKA